MAPSLYNLFSPRNTKNPPGTLITHNIHLSEEESETMVKDIRTEIHYAPASPDEGFSLVLRPSEVKTTLDKVDTKSLVEGAKELQQSKTAANKVMMESAAPFALGLGVFGLAGLAIWRHPQALMRQIPDSQSKTGAANVRTPPGYALRRYRAQQKK
ncbi:hypothetical protein B0H67DRAFT_557336 [Lasiosphaeris hirsuta]|uniref:Uncharacterized protein n=1 Tax=Lasiosphaeris hirsuta TaxID=260670 RepID=A0AA40DKE8_9PEZI|nr:hypothetical protein B0H67DRAFT_557336 [Lasiosphaeris hirsuta]